MEKPQYKVMYDVEDTHFWYVGMRHLTQTLLSRYKIKKPVSILDAGCGTGANMLFLKQYGKVVGIDISAAALRLCKRRGLTAVSRGSINNLPFLNATFDIVTNFDVLGSIGVDEGQAISEFYRVLKPGGILLIRVSAYQWLYSHHDKLVHTARRYNQKSLTSVLKKNDFNIMRSTYANTLLFPLIALHRLWQKHGATGHHSDVTPLPAWINKLGVLPLLLESWLLSFTNLPFGLSLIVIAQKPI